MGEFSNFAPKVASRMLRQLAVAVPFSLLPSRSSVQTSFILNTKIAKNAKSKD
jgi:hypothetical protein